VWSVDTIAAMTDETTEETDETIGATGAELYVRLVAGCPLAPAYHPLPNGCSSAQRG
jgi:hypothetical protein